MLRRFVKLSLLLALLVQTPLMARPIPQAELEKVNTYLRSIGEGFFGDGFDAGFYNGEESEDGTLQALGLRASGNLASHDFNFYLNLDVTDDVEVKVGGTLKGERFTFVELTTALGENLPQVLEKVRKHGFVPTSVCEIFNDSKVKVSFSVVPQAGSESLLKEACVNGEADTLTSCLVANAHGAFNVESALVVRSQKIFTTVFNKLRKSERPSTEDIEEAGEVLREIQEKIGKALEGKKPVDESDEAPALDAEIN